MTPQVAELSAELVRLTAENKVLRRQQYRTERQLTQYESAESDLPTAMRRQTDECNAMREQMRKLKVCVSRLRLATRRGCRDRSSGMCDTEGVS